MPWYRHLLWPFAILYGFGVFLRNRLFDHGLLTSREFEVPIICVGNLETGGTGKSPLVHYIVKLLSDNGRKVAVLSRGYGRKTSGFKIVERENRTDEVGDEPLQIKLRYSETTVVVCESRVEGIENLLQLSLKPDVILMDDGFQHRWVKPGLSILVTALKLPFWKNHLLPVGTLREGKKESTRADVLVISNSDGSIESNGFAGPVFSPIVQESNLIHLAGPKLEEVPQNVVLLSGIANSERFEISVSKHHKVLNHLKHQDHHFYTKTDLQKLMENYDSFGAAVNAVITTEKDAARLINTPLLNHLELLPVYYLPINLEFDGKEKLEFDKMILSYGKHA